MCLCPQPSLTERTADDHRQPHARYDAMGSALRGRLATVLLHHVGGHDLTNSEKFTFTLSVRTNQTNWLCKPRLNEMNIIPDSYNRTFRSMMYS